MIRPVRIDYVSDYRCYVEFNNGDSGMIDFDFIFAHKMYDKVRDIGVFKTIRISDDGMCIEWVNGIDICPDTTYQKLLEQNNNNNRKS